ncbi:hypothetical protein [Cellulomonas sp. URHB0016]
MSAPVDDPRRLRRRALAWSAPALALSLVGGGTLLLGCGAADVTRTAYVVGQSGTAARAAAVLGFVDVVERWKAPFDAGTVAASRATTVPALREAEQLLRQALRSAPPEAQCAVRINLSAVLEALGDLEADTPAAAAADYAAARDVARAAPAGCAHEPSVSQAQQDADEAATGQPAQDTAGDEGPDGSGDGGDGRTAADDLADAAGRAESKGSSATEQATQQAAADAAADAPAPPAPGERAPRDQELAQRTQRAQQDSPSTGDGGVGDKARQGDGVVDVPAPW